MLRIFRAFVWLRFRVLINSLERTGARDTLERFSVATEKLGPIVALTLLIPSSLVLFVLGITAGFALAQTGSAIPILIVRYFLLLVLFLTLVGPVILPMRDSGSVVRHLLLPIPRLDLYLAQMAGGLADPWILLVIPVIVLGIPVGLAVGLKFVAAVIALAAALAFVLFLTGVTSLASSIIHLLLRDRRRGDLVMLIAIFLLPMLGMLPQLLIKDERGPGGRRLTRAERQALPPSTAARAALRLAPYLPSEMYRRTAADAAAGSPIRSAIPLAELAGVALLAQVAGFAAYRRVLDMPVSLGMRRAGSFGGLWDRVVPGLSAGASAVAFTQLRLALRTPRGRASMVTPLIMPLFLGAVLARRGNLSIPGLEDERGLALAAIGAFTSVLALLPIAMNQFAVDRAGFTRQMLSPLTIGELLMGKAVGNALVAGIPASICFVLSLAIFRGTHPTLWLGLVLAIVATYALLAPAAATLSAIFPKAVDLNSIGNSSNAHQAAGLLGMLSFVASAAVPVFLTLLAINILHRPELVALFLFGWTAVAVAVAYLLFIPVRRLVASRCETLAQYY
jgi:hypothetical protein